MPNIDRRINPAFDQDSIVWRLGKRNKRRRNLDNQEAKKTQDGPLIISKIVNISRKIRRNLIKQITIHIHARPWWFTESIEHSCLACK